VLSSRQENVFYKTHEIILKFYWKRDNSNNYYKRQVIMKNLNSKAKWLPPVVPD